MNEYGLTMVLVLSLGALVLGLHTLPVVLAFSVFLVDDRLELVLGGVNLQPARIVGLCVLARVSMSGVLPGKNGDWLVYAYASWSVAAVAFRDPDSVVTQIGQTVDFVAAYLAGRAAFCRISAWRKLLRAMAVVSLPVAVVAIVQRLFGIDVSAGLSAGSAVELRENGFRANVFLPHGILFGVAWASLFPLQLALFLEKRSAAPLLGAVGAVVCVWCSASSTALGALLVGVLSLALFKVRRFAHLGAWGAMGALVSLHFLAARPVWYFIGGFGLLGGSTGYHRGLLIDKGIERFAEWAWFGTRDTSHWHWTGGLWDVTNHFLLEGVLGGIGRVLLAAAIVCLAWYTAYQNSIGASVRGRESLVAWSICASLFGFVAASVGVAFFSSAAVWWGLILAAGISSEGWVKSYSMIGEAKDATLATG